MTDEERLLLEAQREVDAMFPCTPPIAPPEERIEAKRMGALQLARMGFTFDRTTGQWVCPDGARIDKTVVDDHGLGAVRDHMKKPGAT